MKIKNSVEKWKKKRYSLILFLIMGAVLAIVCLSNYEWIQEKINETWKEGNEMIKQEPESIELFTLNTRVQEVIDDSAFAGFGDLLFPIDLNIDPNLSLDDISHSSTFIWYSNIKPNKTVEILNSLKKRAEQNEKIFYPIYTQEEIMKDSSKADTGLFYFKGNPSEKFAIINAGGGFMYVAALHDSFPHALELSEMGINAFALIYRPDHAYEDLAQAIAFVYDHAEELEVQQNGYSLWGGSAGARMAASLGRSDAMERYGRKDIGPASAVITQYTGYPSVSNKDAPTYACVGTNDGIAYYKDMESRLNALSKLGIPTEFHAYQGLSHGFGLGTDTVAQDWIKDAVAFWMKQP